MSQGLSKKLASHSSYGEPRPHFFNLAQEGDQKKLEDVLDRNAHIRIIDTYEDQLLEYFILQNPTLYREKKVKERRFAEYRDEHYGEHEPWQAGIWVYLPWRKTVLHLLEDEMYQEVRTGRNRHLITPEEQKKFYDSTIGIAGLSVGNAVALSIVQSGGGKHMRLADPDTLELTNLNRIRGSISELTEPKVHMAARQIYELDPYAKLELFTEGLTEKNLGVFMDGLDVAIDEIDTLALKVRIRQEAQRRKIPVLMAADNGETGVIDVERHDIEDTAIFHGRLSPEKIEQVVGGDITPQELMQIIGGDLVGFDIHEERMLHSLTAIGKTIPTWPQLGVTAFMNGSFIAAVARRVVTGQSAINGRAVVSMPSFIEPEYGSSESQARRGAAITDFLTKMGGK